MPTLYLIDGLGQFFRAYHAIRTPMTSPVTKEPTNLTFGFVGMMLKLLRAEGPNLKAAGAPDYVAVAMDVGGDRGTFRSQIYPEYKAQRPEPPSDLKPQVGRCLDLLRAIGVPVIGCEGFEADDVMATLVVRLRQQHPDLAIRLVSKDKDLKQLLCDCPPCDAGATPSADARAPGSPLVELFDVHTDTPYSAASLLADTGLRPDQVPDMLTLMGDTVDNVPGVDGVGEKTAAQLLRDFGSLDALLARADEIKGKRGEKLREAIPRLGLSRELVTLRSDVPCDFDLDAASVSRLNLAQLLPILRELGFNRYQDEVRALMAARGDVLEGAEAALANSQASKTTSTQTAAAMLFARPGPPPAITQAAPKVSRARANESDAGPGLFDDMPNGEPLVVRTAQSGTYTAITTRDQLDALIRACEAAIAAGGVLALDTETTSLSFLDAKLCGISLAITPGEAFYIPIRSPDCAAHMCEEDVLAALRPLLESPDVPKCGHNLKYDMLVLRRAGINLQGLSAPGACDTMVASYLLDASRSSHGLDALALAFLNRTNISISELIGSGKNQKCFDSVSLDSATQYAAEDADVALQLRNIVMPQLTEMGLIPLMQAVEMPLVDVLAELEYNGIIVDAAELDRQRARLQHKIDDLLARLGSYWRATLGRNVEPDSPKQLAVALFAKPDDDPPGLGLKAAKKTKTGYSTDAEVLDALVLEGSSPAPEMVLDYRQLSKLVSTYLVALKEAIHPATGRVHTSFHQTVAATGRLASSDPNLQNIPIRTDVGREIRRAFVAPPGHVLITADYSQIELRILAHLSRDPALIEAFQQGADIHQAVAAQIHGVDPSLVTREQRAGAKMVNFGIVYGITSYGLARRLKIGERDAATIIDAYKRRFAGITTFLQECVEQARAKGYVETILKRRRPIPDVDSRIPSRRALAERLAINSVVQGSAADLIKLAMVHLHQDLRAANAATRIASPSGDLPFLLGTKMLLQIHDELVFETPEAHAERAMEHVKTRMQSAMELAVPLVADAAMARNWFEGK